MKNTLKGKVKKHKLFVIGGLVLLILIVVTWVGVAVLAPSNEKDGQRPKKDGHVNMTGELVCLPHKNTDGPHTLECAMGFKSGNDYYALKDETGKTTGTPFNKPIVLNGMFKSESSDVYNMRGSIQVENIELK